jgi:hypothetical protein
MLRQILQVFFFAQVVTESIVEEATRQFQTAGKQWHEFSANGKNGKHNGSTGNHYIDEAAAAAAKDCEKVVESVTGLVSSVWLLLQEYAKIAVPEVLDSVSAVQEKVKEKAASFTSRR